MKKRVRDLHLFPNKLSEFVYLRTYAKWLDNEKRRETWPETVKRYIDLMRERLGNQLTNIEYASLYQAILQMRIMPSMRLLQFAGAAVRASEVTAYNCAYIAPTCIRDFAEIMYIAMCGTGVGFSVEQEKVQQLPIIANQKNKSLPTHLIADSKIGWAEALFAGLTAWYRGESIEFDYSVLRPRGARLMTSGGRSSGPDPLRTLLNYSRDLILSRQNNQLTTLEVHDLICKIGEVVVAGGVRRSAMISLSDVNDCELRAAKQGQFFLSHPERSIANNSAVYTRKPSANVLLQEWQALVEGGSGERGIFNRGDLIHSLPTRRLAYFKKQGKISASGIIDCGTNPCGEIILQSKQFCNLTEVIARPDDTLETLSEKIKLAALLGTYQATFTHFPFLSAEWQKNCEEERLLGVSITGLWDCPILQNAENLRILKSLAINSNRRYAKRFGIRPATAVTCIKPSGTVSQVADCASGMHPRHAPFYMRRIRIHSNDPLFTLLKQQGVPYQPEVGQTENNATTFVLEFPVKSPPGARYQENLPALEHLAYWRVLKENFTEHNPSVTISVADEEWISVLHWLDQHWSQIGGLAFLPKKNHVYRLAPYETITRAQFNQLNKIMKNIDFSALSFYEQDDETSPRDSAACGGILCET